MSSPSTSESGTSIGVIADTALQQHLIGSLLSEEGIEVPVNTSPSQFTGRVLSTPVDLWYVDLTLDERFDEFLDLILGAADVPVLIGDGQAPARNSDEYKRWRRTFLSKLNQQLALARASNESGETSLPAGFPELPPLPLPDVLSDFNRDGPVPSRVWVLGASLGGPGVVKEFLDALPAGLPVAFVYAQHIDAGFQQVLADTVGRHSSFDVIKAKQNSQLSYGEVLLIPVEQEIRFNASGRLEATGKHWLGPYQPNIGQVMTSVLKRFGSSSGAIVFSGMGEDGVEASLEYGRAGASVWAQESSSCASSTMPDAIGQSGHCNYRGTPRELAAKLVEKLAQEASLEAS
ncbi:chemotaxis protein CheB [Aestuariirhabdus sp. Z084]|uniref:chemotaxis protein CheB n=1 Tax=Aestuariirhabdus haliotis TaxID=2918751 RepID=UPI00201B39D5|nr:chemotaxis protein CheB [Aestuariirhabdus haliotis]MCL6414132.1 chemotaxis protein CheB [Aestuariirhabdus haliotis]MCL6418064.1 chemotaxis protein CheB [Aestuariirhabdus haliotis]